MRLYAYEWLQFHDLNVLLKGKQLPLNRGHRPRQTGLSGESSVPLLDIGPRIAFPIIWIVPPQGRQQMHRRDYAAALLALFENARGVTP